MNSTSATFATTHWSVVLAAGQSSDAQASEALEQLCRTCYESPAKVFERNWALALMEQVLERLRAEQQVAGKAGTVSAPRASRRRSYSRSAATSDSLRRPRRP